MFPKMPSKKSEIMIRDKLCQKCGKLLTLYKNIINESKIICIVIKQQRSLFITVSYEKALKLDEISIHLPSNLYFTFQYR